MNKLSGIPTLNAGAPDLRLSGDQTQRGSYVQRRRAQMAGGGIMGSNAGSMLVAPTADGSRPGYADWWKPGSIFQKYIKDPFEMIITGKNPTQIENESQARVDREENIVRDIPADFDPTTDRLADITPTDPGTGPYTPWYEQIFKGSDPTNPDDPLSFDVGDVFGMGKDQYGKYTIPMAIGTAMGKLQQDYLDKQPKFPADETRIKFQTAKQHMEDPEQRIKPQEKYVLPSALVAEGGRIGYQDGMMAKPSYGVEDHFRKDMVENLIEKLKKENPDATLSELITMLNEQYGLAQGGRIGYRFGGNGDEDDPGHEGEHLIIPDDADIHPDDYLGKGRGIKGLMIADMNPALKRKMMELLRRGNIPPHKIREEAEKELRMEPYIKERMGVGPGPILEARGPVDLGPPYHGSNYDYSQGMLNTPNNPEIMNLAQGGRIGYRDGYGVGLPPRRGGKLRAEDFKKLIESLRRRQDRMQVQKEEQRLSAEEQELRTTGIGAAEGGLMDLGGMEKDYRQEGGFVPIGGREKADDVPARLSKNEFVFTADAVRSAGGGDIDAGAQVMENLMENLEAGGKVSEESQGLEGAQEMFANTQRLQNRII